MTGVEDSSPATKASRTWRETVPASADLEPPANGARLAPAAQPVALTSPETTLDTALTLVHAMRDRTETVQELFPLLDARVEIILPGPPTKNEGEPLAPPVVIQLGDVLDLNPHQASAKLKIPTTRLLGAFTQCAILHSSGLEIPTTAIAARLAGWLHGLSPLEGYLVHSVILGGRVPRAARLQMSGVSGLSRAAQLRRSLGNLLAHDPELVDLFETVYRELNPLASYTRSVTRVPQLAETVTLGDLWGSTSSSTPTVMQLIGALHPEFDTADGWLLINRPKRGNPRPTWTVRGLRATHREQVIRLLRTGSATTAEVREMLSRSQVPLAHDDDVREWFEYLGVTTADADAPLEIQTPTGGDAAQPVPFTAGFAEAAELSSTWGELLTATVYPENYPQHSRFDHRDCADEPTFLDDCARKLLDSPFGRAYADTPYALAEEMSRLFNAGLDHVLAALGHGPDPLDALEAVQIPARSLLAELDELLAGPLPRRRATHLRWAVDRARFGGSSAVHFSDSKYELTGMLLRNPQTIGHTEPAAGWAQLTGSRWWSCPQWESEHPDRIPTVGEVRRLNLSGSIGDDALRALESAAFRAEVDQRINSAFYRAVPERPEDAVIKVTVDGRKGVPAVPQRNLGEWETELQSRLQGRYLVTGARMSVAEHTVLREVLVPRLEKVSADPATLADFLLHYPAAVLAGLVSSASLLATDPAAHGIEAIVSDLAPGVDPGAAAVIAQQVRPMLRTLGLEELVELPAGHVREVLVAHTGMPLSAMPAIVDTLTEFSTTVADRSAQRVLSWILDPSQRELLLHLPVGTQNLLRHGGRVVEEYLEDALDLVEFIAAQPDHEAELSAALAAPDAPGHSLPPVLRDGLAAATRAMARADASAETVDQTPRRLALVAGRAADRAARPYLMLDGTNAVCVALPPVLGCPDEPWVVSTEDSVTQTRPRRSLGSRETQLALLATPARRVAVMHPSFHSVVELRLFTTEFPVALFHLDGRQVPTSALVPATQLLALVPPGHEAVPTAEGGPRVLETLDPPEGWGQWSLQLWDLEGLSQLLVHDAAGVHHTIRVGGRELPGLWDTPEEPLEYLVGVSSPTGEPVLSVRPWLSVPPVAADERPWSVSVRRAGSEKWVALGNYAPVDRHEGHPLFDDHTLQSLDLDPAAPLLGGFEVRVEGPDHARVHLPVFVAEGFYAHYPDSPRLPGPDGATSCVAELTCEVPTEVAADPEHAGTRALVCAQEVLEYGPTERSRSITLADGERSETLQIRPPRLEFRMTGHGMAPAWSDQRIARSPFDFEDAVVVVRDPYATLHISLQLTNSGGRVVQRAEFDSSVDGTFRFDTSRFAQRVRTLRTGELRAVVTDPEAEGTRRHKRVVPLVRFAAVEEQHITLDGARLRVTGAGVEEDLVCRVWQLERPWLPAMSLPVHDEVAPLGPELSGAGRLRVDAVVEDPWDPVQAGPLPHRGSTSLQLAGRFSTVSLGLLAQFLAGRGAPSFIAHGLPEVWNAWALLGLGLHPSTDRPLRAELSEHVRRSPRAELLGLDRSSLSSREKLAAFIASGLVNEPVEPPPPGGDTWDRGAAGARRSVDSASRPREGWIDIFLSIASISALDPADITAHTRALQHITEVGGESLSSVLAFGNDPLQESVRLGLPEVQAALDPTMRQILLSRPTIPGPLLDSDARWEGLLALLRNEKAFEAGYVRDQFERMLGKYDTLRRFRPLYKLITERIKALPASVEIDHRRRGKTGSRTRAASRAPQSQEVPMWANIPQLTYSLALLARGHAYGYFKHGPDPDLLDLWARLVAQAPQQILIDLVLAEAHIAHLRLGGSTFLTADARGA